MSLNNFNHNYPHLQQIIMTSSCTSTTTSTGGHTECRSEIPGNDVIAADDKVFPPPKNDVTHKSSTKPKLAGKSPTDVEPSANTAARARRLPIKGTELRSAFSRSPEQIWAEDPGFLGHENYGFEYVKWMEEETRRKQTQEHNEAT